MKPKTNTKKPTWKHKVQKYRYHKNWNKKRITFTDEQCKGFQTDFKYI